MKTLRHIFACLSVLLFSGAMLFIASCSSCDEGEKKPRVKKVRRVRRMEYRRQPDGTIDTTLIVEDDTLSFTLDSICIVFTRELADSDSIEIADKRFAMRHFVEVKKVIPDLIEEIRYQTDHNFVGKPIEGYVDPVALLTKEAADALKEVADELRAKGYRLKIYDAYRPDDAVQHFRRWVGDMEDQKMKEEFYPDTDKRILFKEGYISSRSKHCHGSTVDITLCDKEGEEIDMGGHFDYFSTTSHSDHTETLTSKQLANRQLLRETMEKHGFVIAKSEWWHFALQEEPYPDISFNFPVMTFENMKKALEKEQKAEKKENKKVKQEKKQAEKKAKKEAKKQQKKNLKKEKKAYK